VSPLFSQLYIILVKKKEIEKEKREEELITVMLDGSELSERLMKVFLTLLLKMQLRGWQLLLVLQLVILLRVKRVSWSQVWYVSISISSFPKSVPDPSFGSFILLAPLKDPATSCL
jgi:hypothetical protein